MKVWKEDRWLTDAAMTAPDGSVVRVECPAAAKASLTRCMEHPEKAKVPEMFRTKEYGHGSRWAVRWRDDAGRQRKRNVASSQEADALVASLEDDIRSGRYIDPRDTERKFGEVAALWAETLTGTVKGSTELRYLRELRVWVLPRWESVPIGSISQGRVQAWTAMLSAGTAPRSGKNGEAKPLAPKSVRSIVAIVFRAVLDYAISEGWLLQNPAKGVKLPKQQVQVERVYLTPEEIRQLCSVMKRDDATTVMLLAYTGIRLGEALALRVGDVDYTQHRLSITKTLTQDREGKLTETLPKGNRTRTVPLPSRLEERLHELTDGHGAGDYVIRGPRGGRQQQQNWRNRIWTPALRAAGMDGIPGLTPHSLRHTYASLAIARGADVKALQMVLGHASAVETLDTYADLWPDRTFEVANALDREIIM